VEEHSFWIVEQVNKWLGPAILPLKTALLTIVYGWLGQKYEPAEKVFPDHVVFALLVFFFCLIVFPLMRRSFSMEKPGKIQQMMELTVGFLNSQLEEIVGHGSRKFLPMVGTLGVFILFMNLIGMIPGFLSPTSNINVTAGCAITVFLYYNYVGFKHNGVLKYLKQFAGPVWWLSPLMIPIEIISQLARPFSLSVRLFANIFGEDLIILVFFGLLPLILPLPIMALSLFTSFLQAFIFMVLTMIYLQGAVAEEH
jgi:F-type H+-transporting ATPase subunit a